jgi:hypothetical protein
MTAKRSDKLLQQAVDLVARHGTIAEAARQSGVPEMTLRNQRDEAKQKGYRAKVGAEDMTDVPALQARLKRLESELVAEQKKATDRTEIRQAIIGLKNDVANTPAPLWVLKDPGKGSSPGVPTLMLSDLHWGEVVHPSQINGVNRYNVDIAHKRLAATVERAIHLLKIISPTMDYPGIVLVLGGDMISGNIHDELTATNEINSMPAVLDLFGELVGVIALMADVFGKVFLPCVTGNHGRDTMKIWGKDRHHTSFDWLLFQFLAKHFEKDKRVTFLIPDGPDAYYKIYEHRYLLTHGDQFRGGDGMIGALGPIIRGDHKKRSRNAQIDMEYDTMLIGHWHQYIQLARLIVNGSLKGYDEYAYSNNFGFEPPQQALWLTHPKYRITYRMPVYSDEQRKAPKTNWVSVAA